jgi:predicted RNA-binding Zn-ribbon protein involved in translation (DUF1610 family)
MRTKWKMGRFGFSDALDFFSPALLDEEQCRRWLIGQIQGPAVSCPACGQPATPKQEESLQAGRTNVCSRCGYHYHALSGSFLAGIHASPPEIMLAAALAGAGLATQKIGLLTKRSPSSIRDWLQRFEAGE